MRLVLPLAAFATLAGCANEYSRVPEPSGAWMPANPPSLMAQPTPAPAPFPAVQPVRLRQAMRGGIR